MNTRKVTLSLVSASVLALTGTSLVGAPAFADDEKTKTGACSMSSTWKLELEKDDGEIEVDFDGYTSKADRTWRYVVKQNGDVKDRGTDTTDDDGDFEVDDELRDTSGSDTIVVRAKQPASGEICRAKLSI